MKLTCWSAATGDTCGWWRGLTATLQPRNVWSGPKKWSPNKHDCSSTDCKAKKLRQWRQTKSFLSNLRCQLPQKKPPIQTGYMINWRKPSMSYWRRFIDAGLGHMKCSLIVRHAKMMFWVCFSGETKIRCCVTAQTGCPTTISLRWNHIRGGMGHCSCLSLKETWMDHWIRDTFLH